MKIQRVLWVLFSLGVGLNVKGQDTLPAPVAQFSVIAEREGLRFKPTYPMLVQIAGAPPAFYTSYWEFGDGHFSFEESPRHAYAHSGEYEVILCGTAHYDDNKKPPKPVRKKVTATAYASAPPSPKGVFTAAEQSIALRTNRQPVANQELFCILSYRNQGALYTTSGRLHLFFNERKFPNPHFQFLEARTHYGETPEVAYSMAPTAPVFDWENWSIASTGDAVSSLWAESTSSAEEWLQKARRDYRDERIWRFTELRPGETRNLFVTLLGMPTMVRDTSAFIHLLAVFVPSDPAIPADSFQLEIEIVNSHDPNSIAVSEGRMNFRRAKNSPLEYRVRFQNTGEGPAKRIEITVKTPKSLNKRRIEPLEWYPRCPICTEPPQPGGCLDTAVTDAGVVFTFQNIYLPGTRQRDCSDKDSTKGFVRYRIYTERRLPKLPFRSQASIVFDKNEPVVTNYATTRFKAGLSLGIKAGYGSYLDNEATSSYYFLGASLSPYSSWRTYLQGEVLTGLQLRTVKPERVREISGDINTLKGDLDTLISQRILQKGHEEAFSLELPLLLRRNLSGFFGVGLGASLTIWMTREENTISTTTIRQLYRRSPQGGAMVWTPLGPPQLTQQEKMQALEEIRLLPTVFGDLTLGSVRSGPHIGLRGGWRYNAERWRPFAQLAAHITF
ncbi:MAG: PKD domain-containing protein [Saprospiraceae bacterium]|nr:PKD domain-containing protein [Saprospiraceae bacterium]MDW8483612.1 hypothetical protein [Saprospiraceae bacterium]